MRKSRSYSRRLIGAALLVGVLAGITVGGSAVAAPFTKVTWKVTSLQAQQVIKLHDVVSTNSTGVKTWSQKGSCTLTPRKKPTELKMGATGSCVLKLKIAGSKSYSAKRTQRTITLAPVTTIAPVTTTGDALSCATGGTCVIGEIGPGGGTVFYVASSQFTSTGSACDTACMYLEAAPVGWMKSPSYTGQNVCRFIDNKENKWNQSSLDPQCMWAGGFDSVYGATGTAIGTGSANTSAIITQSSTVGTAATVARAFQGGGKTDWFLPSKDELNALCKWALNDTVNAFCNPGRSTQYGRKGFAGNYYWSSTKWSYCYTDHSWLQEFSTGGPSVKHQVDERYVRPVRAF